MRSAATGVGGWAAKWSRPNASGVRALLTALRKGEVLGILPDQDPGSVGDGNGVFAPFFGITANTMTLVSRLALKTGAPVFLTWAERLPLGRGFALHLRLLPEVTAAASLEASVAAMNRGVETGGSHTARTISMGLQALQDATARRG
jgi:KDO2-lipid IV(A) lauroyltransferase